MQIDFHHAVTYVCSRIAGFNEEDAAIIAYAAQYVDDATSNEPVYFSNKALYRRFASAHPPINTNNLKKVSNHVVWLPFHFLPGNGGMDAGNNPGGSFIEKIICVPNSPLSHEMLDLVIKEKDRRYSLHWLGVAMHVYADTFAHQKFAGVIHKVNDVENVKDIGGSGEFDGRLKGIWRDFLDDAIPPLGHGRADVFPDMPFLVWEYKNGRGEKIVRENPKDFLAAAEAMTKAMQRYRGVAETGLPDADRNAIANNLNAFIDKDGKKRHGKWVESIKNGDIPSLGNETIAYAIGDRKGAWKYEALGTSHDLPVYEWRDEFLTSNWKLFLDAIQAHRFHLLHDILPKYGICAA